MRGFQRTYLYLAALLSLLALLAGLELATNALFLSDLSGAAPWLFVSVVAAASWGIHWHLANRVAATLTIAGAAERNAPVRKAYFYAGQFVALLVMVAQPVMLIYYLAAFGLGQPLATLAPWPARPLAAAAGALIALAVWAYLRWTTMRDGDFGNEAGTGPNWRRAYYYLAATLAILLAAGGAGEFLRAFLRVGSQVYFFGLSPSEANTWRPLVAAALAAVLVGLVASVALWGGMNRAVADDVTGTEVNALSRKLFLYGGMTASAIITLVSLGYLIWQGLMLAFGQPVTDLRTLWAEVLVPPLAYLPVGILLWPVFGTTARSDIEWADESQDAAVLRRLHFYLMSALGLAAFWYGLQALLVLVALLSLGVWPASILSTPRAREYFSLTVALVLVGVPAWWGHWQALQGLARQPGPAGYAERSSILRKIYLYGVVVAAAAVAIITLVLVVVRAPAWLFGPTAAGSFAEALVQFGAGVIVALMWWIAHGVVLRGDERLRAEDERLMAPAQPEPVAAPPSAPPPVSASAEAPPPVSPVAPSARPLAGHPSPPPAAPGAATIVAVVDGADGVLGAALLAALRQAMADLTLWPVGLNATAYAAMVSALGEQAPARLPADAMMRVSVIVGPSDIVAPGGLNGEVPPELAAAMASSAAAKVLLPPRNPQVRWVAAPDWPLDRWVENAVAEVAATLGR